jgi:Tfp pilus assembly protein PilF
VNVEVLPTSANPLNSLANAYQEAGETDLAAKTYAKALEIDPKNRTALEKLKEMAKQ